ncbi:MAG TPA: hypothetical protein VGP25_06480 [Gemmatimonadaceae bacterium]|nr:hypothetical protein [Gemmatimonadaceae bacterium]
MMERFVLRVVVGAAALGTLAAPARAQAVVAAWGNVEGIRVDGEVIPFETSLCTVNAAGVVSARTQKERQQPRYSRSGSRRTITSRLGPISISEVVEDVRRGVVTLDVRFTADSATALRGFLCLDVPAAEWSAPRVVNSARTAVTAIEPVRSPAALSLARGAGRGFAFEGTSRASRRRLSITVTSPAQLFAGDDTHGGQTVHRVLIPILTGPSEPGRTQQALVTLEASGVADHSPVTLSVDARKAGREFDGLGGNFRIQNPTLDPKVIAYNLANLRVAWARVEMPWRTWDPDTTVDPAAKDTAQQDPRVRAAMEMARTMGQRGAPVIVSAWFPPEWAVVGPLPRNGALVNGKRGNPLDSTKTNRIYASITSYLLYLKQHYGVEAAMFSFNESDLGIDVRQTPEEHAALIKGLGAYMQSRGLATTMLLGDVSDATPTWFIGAAMKDRATWPYIGAVSYHSWRGWSDSLLTFWLDAAKTIDKPLLVGEGSTDAGAYRYPLIFQESDMALYEIELYVRLLALSQPRTILQWQLTSDYSLLAGGGLFGDTTALRPTQRFWNLKQLASTPEKVSYYPIACGRAVSCTAVGDAKSGRWAVHVVNTNASRTAVLTGLPSDVKSLRIWTTNGERRMQEGARVPVRAGKARFPLAAASYVSVMTEGR